jgi:carboxyl-terminal processing protease
MGTSDEKLRSRRGLSGLLMSVLLIAGCTADPTSLAAQPPSPLVGEQVFAVGYGRIAEIYLNPVDMGQITTDGLRGLTRMDQSISVDRSPSMVRLTSNGHQIGEFTAPPANDAGGWAAVTDRR